MRLKFSIFVQIFIYCSFLIYVSVSSPKVENIYLASEKPLELSPYDPVHFIIPYVRWKDVVPCSEFFNEDEEFKKTLDCTNILYGKAQDLIKPPGCFIIKEESFGVIKGTEFNYLTFFFMEGKILGFYEDKTATTFIVENVDMANTYRHEVQHHILHKLEGDGNASHDHIIWMLCEPPYYEPSEETIRKNKGRKTSLVDAVINIF